MNVDQCQLVLGSCEQLATTNQMWRKANLTKQNIHLQNPLSFLSIRLHCTTFLSFLTPSLTTPRRERNKPKPGPPTRLNTNTTLPFLSRRPATAFE